MQLQSDGGPAGAGVISKDFSVLGLLVGVAVSGASSGTVAWRAYSLLLCVAWASSQQGNWAPRTGGRETDRQTEPGRSQLTVYDPALAPPSLALCLTLALARALVPLTGQSAFLCALDPQQNVSSMRLGRCPSLLCPRGLEQSPCILVLQLPGPGREGMRRAGTETLVWRASQLC